MRDKYEDTKLETKPFTVEVVNKKFNASEIFQSINSGQINDVNHETILIDGVDDFYLYLRVILECYRFYLFIHTPTHGIVLA